MRPYRELRDAIRPHLGDEGATFPPASPSAALRPVERGPCVGAMPAPKVAEGLARGGPRVFDPGFAPPVPRFSAAYRTEPPSRQVASAAAPARDVFVDFLDARRR